MRLLVDSFPRIPEDKLKHLEFTHMDTMLNEACSRNHISGYTEWICRDRQTLSVGWSWYIDTKLGKTDYQMEGLPFTNLIILSNDGLAYPEDLSLKKISDVIATWPWQRQVADYTAKRYAFQL